MTTVTWDIDNCPPGLIPVSFMYDQIRDRYLLAGLIDGKSAFYERSPYAKAWTRLLLKGGGESD